MPPASDTPLRLIEGNRIRCPRDKRLRPIFAYKSFEQTEEFSDELNVVLKCPCGHIFSPGVDSQTIKAGMLANAAVMAHVA